MEKVLVAEDSPALANLLDYVLSSAGYDVSIYRNGLTACAAASAEEFDVIMLDQQMPGMTGMEVLKSIRTAGPNRGKPVFLCTAKTHELDLQSLENDRRITGVFHKPFSPKKLVERLKSATAEDVFRDGCDLTGEAEK